MMIRIGVGGRGILIRQFARIFAVVVCLSVLLAGFAASGASNSLHDKGVSATGVIAVASIKDCGHSTGKKSDEHSPHGTCNGCLNCFTFTVSAYELAAISTPSLHFIISPVQKLANRTIIPPSPPPKSSIRV